VDVQGRLRVELRASALVIAIDHSSPGGETDSQPWRCATGYARSTSTAISPKPAA
jgi:hypothetical protein